MSEKKDTSVIPKGMYCYTPDDEKNNNKDENDPYYYTKVCPYWGYIEDEGVAICHCSFLNESVIPNGTSKKDFKKLEKKYGKDGVWEKFSGGLIWDQVKDCGENKEW